MLKISIMVSSFIAPRQQNEVDLDCLAAVSIICPFIYLRGDCETH